MAWGSLTSTFSISILVIVFVHPLFLRLLKKNLLGRSCLEAHLTLKFKSFSSSLLLLNSVRSDSLFLRISKFSSLSSSSKSSSASPRAVVRVVFSCESRVFLFLRKDLVTPLAFSNKDSHSALGFTLMGRLCSW